jgi:hypothetical protein
LSSTSGGGATVAMYFVVFQETSAPGWHRR